MVGILSMTIPTQRMNYLEIDTAADLLDAFKQCQNAGQEIQLFESLAEREHPPVDAFVEILKRIKLETVLALTIQAFGKITNVDVKENLKGSDDLLVMLCEQAKSGATDLIRWSAATAIENVGFSFINISQYLTEEPSVIIQQIVKSKLKVFHDAERSSNQITENNDYDSFIRFWVYGATYELRMATVDRVSESIAIVVYAVVKAQDIWGIRHINILLIELLQNSSPDFLQFIFVGHYTSANILEERASTLSSLELKVLIYNQILCVSSYDAMTRKCAVNFLCNYDYPSVKADDYNIKQSINTIRDAYILHH
jgi:hypothetical protein